VPTECNTERLGFQPLEKRELVGIFDGGDITSDAGGLLLREADEKTGIIARLAECFTDYRVPELIEHTVAELVAQRVYGLALGYEDLVDHDQLRHDPLLAVLAGKSDPTGQNRAREQDRGKALAGKSTLNRLELSPPRANEKSRYKKITADLGQVESLLTDFFIEAHPTAPKRIVLDFDATDDPIHGHQLGRFFQGYYKEYCYLPLYVFCGEHLLCAQLRPADQDGAAGSVAKLAGLVERIRREWPSVQIIVRGDSGFCRENLMAWCEANDVDYILGLAKNDRLRREIDLELELAKAEFQATGEPARRFRDFRYQTLTSWFRERRVVGKAECLAKGMNPRFVVTSLSRDEYDERSLYEDLYCARGDMENRIKEQQLMLFADRTSAGDMRANQIRLYFSSIAYVLLSAMRRIGLAHTSFERAQCNTIRLKLLKVGALVRITVRKIWISFSSSYPYRDQFMAVLSNIRRAPPRVLRC
jgi:Transposase DDE domain group 1